MKLVRDNIPEIIKSKGKIPKSHIANGKEYEEALINKLKEELNEIIEGRNLEEVADLIEVAYALGQNYGSNEEKINQIRDKKNQSNGKFTKKIILE